jgi:hypothetical protein
MGWEEQGGRRGSNQELRLKHVNRQQMILRAVDVERRLFRLFLRARRHLAK